MFHFYFYNQERFMDSYRKRSNVETTLSMIKARFGEPLEKQNPNGSTQRSSLQVLAHNRCCLVRCIYELGNRTDVLGNGLTQKSAANP